LLFCVYPQPPPPPTITNKTNRYTYTTSTGYGGKEKGPEARLADKWFQAQREFYVGVGKSFGDTRAV
jgi:hypothetical protein